MTNLDIAIAGVPGESFASQLRRLALYGVTAGDSDAQAIAKFRTSLTTAAETAEAAAQAAQHAAELARDQAASLVLPQNIFVDVPLSTAEAATTVGDVFKVVSSEDGSATVYDRTSGGSNELYREATTAALAGSSGASLIGYYSRTLQDVADELGRSALRHIPTGIAGGHAAIFAGTSTVDVTDYIQEAIDAAYDEGRGYVRVPCGRYLVAGQLSMRSGVTLIGQSLAGEYFQNSPYDTTHGAMLYKPGDADEVPMLQMATGAAVTGLNFKDRKSYPKLTGTVQWGGPELTDVLYNAVFVGNRLYGHAIDEITEDWQDAKQCGIYFPDSDVADTPSRQRYGNLVLQNHITLYDVGARLGAESNCNTLDHNVTRQCYVHYQIDGSISEVVDLRIGVAAYNIGPLPTAPMAVFKFIGGCSHLKAFGFSETNGRDIDFSEAGTLVNIDFSGVSFNEAVNSFPPAGVTMPGYARPVNRGEATQHLITSSTGDLGLLTGIGNDVEVKGLVSGTLPQLNSPSLSAADVSSKKIIQFNSAVYSRARKPTLYCELDLRVNAPGGGVGTHLTRVRFVYRNTNNVGNAGQLSVLEVEQVPSTGNYVAALGFLTGVAAGGNFAIAMAGGNFGAQTPAHIIARLKVDANTYTFNTEAMRDYASISLATAALTANDVTDAISLLTVADTNV